LWVFEADMELNGKMSVVNEADREPSCIELLKKGGPDKDEKN